jgi:DNA-binding response OmpR family regulator
MTITAATAAEPCNCRRLCLAASNAPTLRNGPLEVDLERLSVRVRGKQVHMSGLQLKLLMHLARHADWVLTRSQLIAAVWGLDEVRDPKVVDILVCRLRRRLGVAGRLIESVRSFGYRFRLLPDAEE